MQKGIKNTITFVLAILILLVTAEQASAAITVTQGVPADATWDFLGTNLNFSYTPTSDNEMLWCRLIANNSVLKIKSSPANATANYFYNINFNANGTYNWLVECMDNTTAFANSSSRSLIIRLDTSKPVILVNTSSASAANGIANFTYTAYDVESGIRSCTLYVDDAATSTHTPTNNTQSTFSSITIGNGTHIWSITCWDHRNNSASTGPLAVTSEASYLMSIQLVNPANGTTVTSRTTFTYIPMHNANKTIVWCGLYFNKTLNETSNRIIANVENNFTSVETRHGASWQWHVGCIDNLTNKANSSINYLNVDLYKLVSKYVSVTLNNPDNDIVDIDGKISFEYTPQSVANITSCSLITNESIRSTNKNVKINFTNSFEEELSNGVWTWKIRCIDESNTTYTTSSRTVIVKSSASDVLQERPYIAPNYSAESEIPDESIGPPKSGIFIWTALIYVAILAGSFITFLVVNEEYLKKLSSLFSLKPAVSPEKRAQLKEYVATHINRGHSKEHIKHHLLHYGWKKKIVDEVIQEVEEERKRHFY